MFPRVEVKTLWFSLLLHIVRRCVSRSESPNPGNHPFVSWAEKNGHLEGVVELLLLCLEDRLAPFQSGSLSFNAQLVLWKQGSPAAVTGEAPSTTAKENNRDEKHTTRDRRGGGVALPFSGVVFSWPNRPEAKKQLCQQTRGRGDQCANTLECGTMVVEGKSTPSQTITKADFCHVPVTLRRQPKILRLEKDAP